MAKLPYLAVYVGDELAGSISGCSLEAQGFWLRIRFIMHTAERYGYLIQDGQAIPLDVISRRVGASLEQSQALLNELRRAQVFAETSAGIIYSESMVNQANLREERAKAGRKGGLKQKRSKTQASTQAKREIEYVNENDFDVVWSKYPNKDGKRSAFAAFKSTVKSKDDLEAIRKALDNYLGSERVKAGYVKNGSTWFNNWRDWVDFKEVKRAEKPDERISGEAAYQPGKYDHLR